MDFSKNNVKQLFLLPTIILLVVVGLFAFSLSHTHISTTKAAITDGLVGYWTFDEGNGTTASANGGR